LSTLRRSTLVRHPARLFIHPA